MALHTRRRHRNDARQQAYVKLLPLRKVLKGGGCWIHNQHACHHRQGCITYGGGPERNARHGQPPEHQHFAVVVWVPRVSPEPTLTDL